MCLRVYYVFPFRASRATVVLWPVLALPESTQDVRIRDFVDKLQVSKSSDFQGGLPSCWSPSGVIFSSFVARHHCDLRFVLPFPG